MENFRKLGLGEDILKVLSDMKFEKPTEIQEKAIPLVLQGKDVIGGAATGSGKTLAFGAAVIQNTVPMQGVQALILTPTRELAQQVMESLELFSSNRDLRFCSVFGGVSYNPQVRAISNSEVVVGTPGRILDHLKQGTLRLDRIKTLVLDEADRMLDMGFVYDVKRIISKCAPNRQTMLFSATINSEISRLAKEFMKNPEKVSAESNVDPKKLVQLFYDVPDSEKFSLLVHLLKNDPSDLVMVFCNTKRNTDFVADNLKLNGIKAMAIHGGHSQNKRSDTLERFQDKNIHVLVCTDVAARGLDIKGVSHVYNYDSSIESDAYVHRIGRTARAGANGKAVTILGTRDYENFSRINRQHPELQRQETPSFERAEMAVKARRSFGGERRGGFGGRGRSEGGSRGGFSRSSSNFGSRPRSNFRSREGESSGDSFRPRNNFRSRDGGRDGGERRSFGGNRNSFRRDRRESF